MPGRWQEKLRTLRDDSDRWLAERPRLKRALDATGCMKTDRHAIARGVAAGLLVALTPVFGIQTFVLMLVCVLMHANFPVAFAASWLSNPFTIGPIIVAANAAGREIVAPLLPGLAGADVYDSEAVQQTALTLLGSVVIAVPAALLGYVMTLALRRTPDSTSP